MNRQLKKDLEELYTKHYDRLLAFGLRYCPANYSEKEVVKDIMQDTYAKCVVSLDKYNPSKSSLKTWFSSCLKNKVMDYFKLKSTKLHMSLNEQRETWGKGQISYLYHLEVSHPHVLTTEFAYPEIREFSNLISHDVKKCINGLRTNYKNIILHHFFDDTHKSPEDRCRKLNINQDAYRQKLKNAKKSFRESWMKEYSNSNLRYREVIDEGKHLYDV